MPQAKLPDLNNYWIKYHDRGMWCITNGYETAAIATIYSMNALLPDEYRLEVDTDKHTQLTAVELIAVCGHCNEQTSRKDIKVFELLLTLDKQLITGNKSINLWNCTKCEKQNELKDTKFIKNQNASPFYYKVIPEPPALGEGLLRRERKRKLVVWYYSALEELDHQLGLYRTEYEAEGERDDISEWEEE